MFYFVVYSTYILQESKNLFQLNFVFSEIEAAAAKFV